MAELPGSTRSHLSPMKNRFFLFLYLALASALLIGCQTAEKVTTTKITFVVGTNKFSVANPKDTEIEKLQLLPNGGLILEGYKSRVNAAALEANREQYRFSTQLFGETLQQNRQMLEWLMRGGAQAYGIPLGTPPSASQPQFRLEKSAPPPGLFYMSTNSVVVTNFSHAVSTGRMDVAGPSTNGVGSTVLFP